MPGEEKMDGDRFRKLYHGYANKHAVGHAFDRDLDSLLSSARRGTLEEVLAMAGDCDLARSLEEKIKTLIGKEGAE